MQGIWYGIRHLSVGAEFEMRYTREQPANWCECTLIMIYHNCLGRPTWEWLMNLTSCPFMPYLWFIIVAISLSFSLSFSLLSQNYKCNIIAPCDTQPIRHVYDICIYMFIYSADTLIHWVVKQLSKAAFRLIIRRALFDRGRSGWADWMRWLRVHRNRCTVWRCQSLSICSFVCLFLPASIYADGRPCAWFIRPFIQLAATTSLLNIVNKTIEPDAQRNFHLKCWPLKHQRQHELQLPSWQLTVESWRDPEIKYHPLNGWLQALVQEVLMNYNVRQLLQSL